MSKYMERRKLFSSPSNNRRKLFSTQPEVTVLDTAVPEPLKTKKYICLDCGYLMEVGDTTTELVCPKCGGKRFNIYSSTMNVDNVESGEEKTFTRKSLFNDSEFEKEFTNATNDFEKNLKMFSGKTLSDEDVEKTFSMSSDDLVDKGFAVINDEGVKLTDTAFLQSKLFSKLIVSVTKVLDLNPEAMSCESKESFIDSNICKRDDVTPKGIILIKKAHCLNPLSESNVTSDDSSIDNWAKDSGIVGDLKYEFGNKNMSVEEFTDLLKERYSDAPKGLIDFLVSHGHIGIQGNNVDILN